MVLKKPSADAGGFCIGGKHMDNFKVIYLILRILERALDGQVDTYDLSPGCLGVSQKRRDHLLLMMQEAGYISGVQVIRAIGMEDVRVDNIHITLKGLEYLEENSLMKKACRMLKDIKDMTPGL